MDDGVFSGQNLTQSIFNTDLRDLDTPYTLPGETENVSDRGRVCYISFNPLLSATSGVAGVVGSILQNVLLNSATDFFIRVQDLRINERPLTQVKQSFDGVYAGLYGGGVSKITLSGITKIWSGRQFNDWTVNGGEPINSEIEMIGKLFNLMSNAKGAVFEFHDGIRARKWPVIPVSFTSVKSVSHPNLETYEAQFVGASFGQKFRHIDTAGVPMLSLHGPTATLQKRNLF